MQYISPGTNFCRVSFAMRRYHDLDKSYKGKLWWRLAYSYRGLLHYHDDVKYGCILADMILEKGLRALILIYKQQKETGRHTEYSLNIWNLKAGPHCDTLLPIRSHLLTMPLPIVQASKNIGLSGAFVFKQIHSPMIQKVQYKPRNKISFNKEKTWHLYLELQSSKTRMPTSQH